ncbi:hypothetical protein PoB_006520400 [Plakobranchus ocellatus]|uniref:Uncharacterized protein n=1 Tax=Plakobranchus ocellatus TaxID=259542 RepID=A0AAV4D3I1_9GAST|nr:hypothetical protein PoB_006520400 [Plakobranchus ocellatus]
MRTLASPVLQPLNGKHIEEILYGPVDFTETQNTVLNTISYTMQEKRRRMKKKNTMTVIAFLALPCIAWRDLLKRKKPSRLTRAVMLWKGGSDFSHNVLCSVHWTLESLRQQTNQGSELEYLRKQRPVLCPNA